MPLWSWGSDVYGRLGHGTEDVHCGRPKEVKALTPMRLTAAVCGSAHNVVVYADGQCYSWGKCHYGQLGHGEMDKNELVPRPVEALRDVRISSVAAGDSHVIAITAEGRVYTWGVGFYGCLGHGDETALATPKLVEKLRGERIVSASGGAFHSMTVTEAGRVFVWGRDHRGQLGLKPVEMPNYGSGGGTKLVHLNQKEPVELTLPLPCKMVSLCNDHSLVLLTDGTILSFGDNDSGQLGRKERPGAKHKVEALKVDPSHFKNSAGDTEPVSTIAAGWNHCAAVTQSGLLFTWGGGRSLGAGLGHSKGLDLPALVEEFPKGCSPKFTHVRCGDSFTIALSKNGQLWAMGMPDYGKLGVGGGGMESRPKLVHSNLPGISGIRCGTNHTIAYSLCQDDTTS